MTKTHQTNKAKATPKRDTTSIAVTFRAPKWLVDELDKDAEKQGRNTSNLLRFLLTKHYS